MRTYWRFSACDMVWIAGCIAPVRCGRYYVNIAPHLGFATDSSSIIGRHIASDVSTARAMPRYIAFERTIAAHICIDMTRGIEIACASDGGMSRTIAIARATAMHRGCGIALYIDATMQSDSYCDIMRAVQRARSRRNSWQLFRSPIRKADPVRPPW